MTHYVLVHGAWEAAWSWDETRLSLEQQGHKVTALDLPGTPANHREIPQVTFESYVNTVADTVRAEPGKVVLVGHSLAGAVISQVAEQLPDMIEKLVYAAGFLLGDGDNVLAAMQRDVDGEFLRELTFSVDQGSATAAEWVWRDKAFHDVDPASVERVLPLVDRAQATAPFMANLVLSAERFGKTPKVYIRTSLDKMVSPKFQDQMLENWEVGDVYTLESGHFPTLSMPAALAQLML